ncbi:transposase, partial [Pseudonocardia sp. GCM10023141]
MLDRHDLTDEEWARLAPLLPPQTRARGGRWADHRMVINGVFWRTRCGL